ncbi:MAG: hypothetical protein ACRC92_23930 [Peptostreptococcaceae bacterium]
MDFAFVREEDKEYIERHVANVNRQIKHFDDKDLDVYIVRNCGTIYKYTDNEFKSVNVVDCKYSDYLYHMGYLLKCNSDGTPNHDETILPLLRIAEILKSYRPTKTVVVYESTQDIYFMDKVMSKDEAVSFAFCNCVGLDRGVKRSIMRKVRMQPKDYKGIKFTVSDRYELMDAICRRIFKNTFSDADVYINKSTFSATFNLESILEYKLIKAILWSRYIDDRYYKDFKGSYNKKYNGADKDL